MSGSGRAGADRAGADRANVKPLTHWVIYKGYTVRFTTRTSQVVTGVLTTPAGEVAFRYDPARRIVELPDATLAINDFGWEIDRNEDTGAGSSPTIG